MSPAICCAGLVKTYPGRPPVEAVRGVDLTVQQGECFGLLGPNGAGKTTTIEILEGLLEKSGGDVEVLGLQWGRDDRALRERIGISLQETKLSEKLTVRETLNLFRSFYRQGLTTAEAIRRVSLEAKERARVGKLSGGQKQRLAVACALIGDPDLLFLDEPTTGLDPQARRQVWDIIRDLKARGRTVLLTTHYMDEAERLCDRVAIVDQGKVIALGTPPELIASVGGEHIIEFQVGPVAAEGPAGEGLALELPSRSSTRPIDDICRQMDDLPTVQAVRYEESSIFLTVHEPHRAIPALLSRLQQLHRPLTRLTTRHTSLEDVFVHLTGRHLQEGETAAP